MIKQTNSRVLVPLALGVAVGAAIAAYPRLIRPRLLRWGATENEVLRVLPGDEFVAAPRVNSTRAITIRAPVHQVWPWLAQMGQYRGGLYVQEWLENLFGADVHNAERIIPELQNVKTGDYFLMYPTAPGYAVAMMQEPQFLILQTVNTGTGEFTRSVALDEMHGTLTFFLEPRIDNTTRLILRTRLDYEPGRLTRAAWRMVEPVTFMMERQLLRGIRERAESHRVANEMLDRFMPEYEFRGVESIVIHASPEQIFQALEHVRGQDMLPAQAVGQARSKPQALASQAPPQAAPEETFAETIAKMGLVTLSERTHEQIVLGSIAKFHELLDRQFVRLRDADEFRRFLHGDYQKLAISLAVTGGDSAAGYTLTLEHRTHAMSEHARRQFARYWLALKPGGSFVSRQLLGAVKRRAEGMVKESLMWERNKPASSTSTTETALPAAPRYSQDPTLKPKLAPA